MRTITGPLKNANGADITEGSLILRALLNNHSADGTVPVLSEYSISLAGGFFSTDILFGTYEVLWQLDSGARHPLGKIAVETGGAITIGELLDQSQGAIANLYPDTYAQKDWVLGQIAAGAAPYDIPITGLNPGTGTSDQYLRISADGLLVVGFSMTIHDIDVGVVAEGELLQRIGGQFQGYQIPDPRYKTIASPYVATDGDLIILNPGDQITLPTTDKSLIRFSPNGSYSDFQSNPATIKRGEVAHSIFGVVEDMTVSINISFGLVLNSTHWRRV